MTLKITQEKQNSLFNRKEIEAEFESAATPSKADILKSLADQTKASEDTIIIKNILGGFGSQTFKITAMVYNSKEDLEKCEGKVKEPEAKEEAAPAEKPAEASKEEVKEETKPEASDFAKEK